MKKALVVIDMQNDFITGVLGNDECRAVVPQVVKRVQEAIEDGRDIIFSQDTHQENYLSTQEGRKLPVLHCVQNTDGWKIISELAEIAIQRGIVFTKETFGSRAIAEYIKEHNYDEVELVGVCTDICVISNAMIIKAFAPESEIFVNESCCAGVTPQSHKTAIEAMKSCQITIL
ncbi:MAG: cysteine hydrolase [Lachnospiraceae bacterium]|nr:cysteine hydrolase [Lachnospiraceae bacterium]MDE6128001.1 cysteine hydrolase [Lachnospiraceae bacterium]